MQPRTCQAGPLVAATATKVALAQTVPGAGYLALNGAAGASTANNICLSQSGTAATALLINGALKQTLYTVPALGIASSTIAMLPSIQLTPGEASKVLTYGSPIYITSAGDESAHTFVVVGTAATAAGPPIVISETITGANTSVVASANVYKSIISITSTNNTTSTVTVGAMGFATLDKARQLLFTSSGNDSGLTLTVSGGDWAGTPISETVTGGNLTATTKLNYLTVNSVKISGSTAGTISVGTNGVCASQWINFDSWSNVAAVMIGCDVSGTVNYTIQLTQDDPDSYANPTSASAMTWVSSSDPGAVGATGAIISSFTYAPAWARILLNSGSGTVTGTFTQLGSP